MEALLRQGLAAMGLPETAAPALADYAGRLLRQNEVMNLTAITDPAAVAQLHLLDSAAVARHIDLAGKRVVDVGTGAGLPGMVLRLLNPDFDLTLLDSLGKRVDWLATVCRDMDLPRVECVHARAEEFAAQRREGYDVAVSRAVAQLNVLCELMLPLVKVGGVMVAMKSVGSDQEIAAARGAIGQLGGRVRTWVDYPIPGTDVTHRLVVVDQVKPTPQQYPRSFAKIKKQPLR
ncbi:MAG: 16S rRNA (guanine(527)-N(7))-methyltransferase RsmG [Oscillospiraceae bacterium]|nr:16S rRNA (guanine(527)-N(7))-methyltransferase RsmG [Oscillospiraceae bacterium]